jgi:hypothetical protein
MLGTQHGQKILLSILLVILACLAVGFVLVLGSAISQKQEEKIESEYKDELRYLDTILRPEHRSDYTGGLKHLSPYDIQRIDEALKLSGLTPEQAGLTNDDYIAYMVAKKPGWLDDHKNWTIRPSEQ